MGRRFLWILLALVLGALALPAVSLAAEDFNVTVTVGWENCYRPMEWTPIEVNIANSKLKKPFGGTLLVSAQQDGLNKLTVGRKFVLTPDSPVDCAMVTKFTYGVVDCRVQILNARGRTSWSTNLSLMDSSTGIRLSPVEDGALLIGVAGRMSSSLLRLGGNSVCEHGSERGHVHVKRKVLNRLPQDWTGYAGLDLLVLYDPDWNSLTVHQSRAIARWVTNGGRLLIVLGTRPLPASGPIAGLVPFRPGPLRQIKIPASAVSAWGFDPALAKASGDVSCWPLDGATKAGWVADGGKSSFFAYGPVAFGKVAVLGFDPYQLVRRIGQPGTPVRPSLGARPARSPSEQLARFWTAQLRHVLGPRQIRHQSGGWGGPRGQYYGGFGLGRVGLGSNAVVGHLMSIPEMRPLSIWWVILLLALLAVLLGPVDYIVLKRLGKLPLTWITSTALIALFSVGAYYGVQALRAGTMKIRVVSVIDAVEGSKDVWSTQYAGIFAPASRNYGLSGTRPSEWWSGITAARDEHSFYRQPEIATRQISCLQEDGGNRPASVPINIWTMQCLLTEAREEKPPFSASVERAGGALKVSIVNHSDVPIRRGYVRMDRDQKMEFGPVDAGGEKAHQGRLSSARGWDDCLSSSGSYMTAYPSGRKALLYFDTDSAYFARGSLRRTSAIQEYLRRGAAVVCVEYPEAPVSFGVAGRACEYSHIRLARMVVFPKKLSRLP